MPWPIIAANILGGVAGWLSNRSKAKGYENAGNRAGETSLGAFNYLQGSPMGQQYLPMGGNAAEMQGNLLGLGDSGAGNAAYKNYLGSIGYQSQLQSGQQAITGSAAARGLLGSGSTAKALTRYGQDLSKQSFNNYLGQLSGVAGQGLQAGGMIGNAAMAGYGNAARYQFAGGTGASDARAGGWEQLVGGLGGAYDAWQTGRGGGGKSNAGYAAGNPRIYPG
jgi:hypothetical protein